MDMLKDKVKPLYFKLLASAAGSSFITCIFGFVDAMVVGKYHGPDGTAALAVFIPIWSFMYGLGFITGIGGSVLFSNDRGSGEKKSSNEYFTVSVIYSLILAVVTFLVIHFFSEPLFRFFGADDTLLPLAQKYLQGVKIALPFCIFSNLLAAYLRNDGNAVLATVAVLVGGAFNLFGDIFFVFTCDMGILGAGLATAGSLIISVLIMLTHFLTKKNTLKLVKPTKAIYRFGKITAVGFPTALNDIAAGIIAILFNRQIMKYLNSDALAVYGILTQVTAFVQCCAYSVGQAVQPIMSQNLGAKQNGRIKECLRYGLYTTAAFGVLWTALTLLVPNAFVHFFMTPTESVLAIAPKIIGTYGLSYLLLTFNIFSTYYFQATLHPTASTVVSVGRGLVISSIAIMLLPMAFGGDAIWFAMLVTELAVGAFAAWQMLRCTKQLKD